MNEILRTLCIATLGTVGLGAQVTVKAKTLAGLSVRVTSGQKAIPASTDITAGASLSIVGTSSAPAQASTAFGLATGPDLIQFTFDSSAQGRWGIMASEDGYSGPSDVEVRLVAPVRTRVSVFVEDRGAILGDPGSASLGFSIPGVGAFSYAAQLSMGCLFQPPKTASHTAYVDAGGLAIQLTEAATGRVGLNASSGTGNMKATVKVTPDPDYPCRTLVYGTSCGVGFAATTDFVVPGSTLVTVSDARVPALGWYILGAQKLSVPFLGCTLYNDVVVLLPALVDRQGNSRVRVIPPPVPNGYFVAQAGTWDGVTLLLSAGLEFFCY